MKKVLIAVIAVAVAAFAWWTISPLFIDKVVEDELDPEIAALLEAETTAVTPSTPTDNPTPTPITTTADEVVVPATDGVEGSPVTTPNTAAEPPATPLTEQPAAEISTPTQTSEPEPTTQISAPLPIVDTPGHPATGNIRVISTEDTTIVRYEDYDGTNGPDLKIYLTNDLEEAGDFVSLGAARGNQGNINYTVPNDVDISDYQYVVTWCEAFGVLFDYAEIN